MIGALMSVAPRIGQLLRLLSSDKDGEVLAAARALGRTLTGVGADFHDLAATIEGKGGDRRQRPDDWRPRPDPDDWDAVISWLTANSYRLRKKERAFVDSMVGWDGEPTERQAAWLQALYERLGGER